jgi:hypothetical protein
MEAYLNLSFRPSHGWSSEECFPPLLLAHGHYGECQRLGWKNWCQLGKTQLWTQGIAQDFPLLHHVSLACHASSKGLIVIIPATGALPSHLLPNILWELRDLIHVREGQGIFFRDVLGGYWDGETSFPSMNLR